MALNGISTQNTKQLKQEQKLEIAEAKKQGKTVTAAASSYSITGSVDDTVNYYRSLNELDIDLLPTKYSGNAIVDNTTDGNVLTLGRPWI